MRHLSWMLALSTVVCFAPPSDATAAWGAVPAGRAAYLETLDLVWQTLAQHYFDPTFGGMSWEGLRDRYRERLGGAPNDSVFFVTMNEMLFELGVSHLGVIPESHPEWIGAPSVFADGDVGADVRILEDTIVVVRVDPGSPAAVAGLRPGYEITAIDGETLDDIRDQALAPPRPPLDERMLIVQRAQSRLYGSAGTDVVLSFIDYRGRRGNLTLTRRERPGRVDFIEGLPPAFLQFESRWVGDDLGYIRFNAFHPALLDSVLEAIGRMHEADGIIFDLRGNPGGEFPVRRAIAEHLVRERGVFWRYQHRDEVRDIVLEPEPDGYRGRVVVITDVLSASSSEEFAGALQAVGRAIVVGERTPGIVLTAEVSKLPIGATLVYPNARTLVADGSALEGRGVIPDVAVELRRGDLAAGRDTQLEAAVRCLRRVTSASPSPR